MSFTPFNAPLLAPLLGDPELTPRFSVQADLAAMLHFEAALARAEAVAGVIPADAGTAIDAACKTFAPDIRELGEGAARDGLVVPTFVEQLRAHVGNPHAMHVHLGATSQDLIDTSLVLRLRDVIAALESRLDKLNSVLTELSTRHGSRFLMGRTRMQAAVPITVADRIRIWQEPLKAHRARLQVLRPELITLQFGGAAGTLEKLGDRAREVTEQLARELDLTAPLHPWHTDRTAIADFAHWLAMVTGSLGKVGQDIALMAQNGIDEIAVSGTGSSSTMPHKQNPVRAEVLVTLARFNAMLISGMHHSIVHEQERSGAAWTLEWMILPQMVIATGAATRTAITLLESIKRIGPDSDAT